MTSSQVDMLFDAPMPDIRLGKDEVAVVAVAYNEELRLADFLRHHRELGITRFFIVDNGSTDGTAEILNAQADVIRIPASKPFKDHKVLWRQAICDRYLAGKWVLALDIDELFIFAGRPEAGIPTLLRELDREGSEGLFCSLVDMYSDKPMAELDYKPGGHLVETCPYFDGTGYRLMDRRCDLDTYPTPFAYLYGGPRERMFSSERHSTLLDRLALRTLFNARRTRPLGPAGRFLAKRAARSLRNGRTEPSAVMSKVPLVKWQRGMTACPGQHIIGRKLELSRQRGALLHFKYLQDFPEKARTAAERGQYANNSAHYKSYLQFLDRIENGSFLYPESRRYSGPEEMVRAGLLLS